MHVCTSVPAGSNCLLDWHRCSRAHGSPEHCQTPLQIVSAVISDGPKYASWHQTLSSMLLACEQDVNTPFLQLRIGGVLLDNERNRDKSGVQPDTASVVEISLPDCACSMLLRAAALSLAVHGAVQQTFVDAHRQIILNQYRLSANCTCCPLFH